MVRNRFAHGNQAAKRRKNRGGGRPRREVAQAKRLQKEVERLAADLAKKYLEDHLEPILDAYIAAATGEKCGRFKRKFDPATCRHAVERFVGPAPRSVVLDMQETIETFFEQVQKMESEGEGKGIEQGRCEKAL